MVRTPDDLIAGWLCHLQVHGNMTLAKHCRDSSDGKRSEPKEDVRNAHPEKLQNGDTECECGETLKYQEPIRTMARCVYPIGQPV
jgi:hypothetical protein